jgi:hypothetical protein
MATIVPDGVGDVENDSPTPSIPTIESSTADKYKIGHTTSSHFANPVTAALGGVMHGVGDVIKGGAGVITGGAKGVGGAITGATTHATHATEFVIPLNVRNKIATASKGIADKAKNFELLPPDVPDTIEKVDEMLALFDADGDGIFTRDEVRTMARHMMQIEKKNKSLKKEIMALVFVIIAACGAVCGLW